MVVTNAASAFALFVCRFQSTAPHELHCHGSFAIPVAFDSCFRVALPLRAALGVVSLFIRRGFCCSRSNCHPPIDTSKIVPRSIQGRFAPKPRPFRSESNFILRTMQGHFAQNQRQSARSPKFFGRRIQGQEHRNPGLPQCSL